MFILDLRLGHDLKNRGLTQVRQDSCVAAQGWQTLDRNAVTQTAPTSLSGAEPRRAHIRGVEHTRIEVRP